MLGMEDSLIALAWLLSLGSAITCVIYGMINWNKGGEDE